jgi:hypothetical protein
MLVPEVSMTRYLSSARRRSSTGVLITMALVSAVMRLQQNTKTKSTLVPIPKITT